MDPYTEKTKQWLEERFQRGVSEGRYFAHRPIYGFGQQPSERSHTARMALALAILRVLNRLEGDTLLDLGGGEGYIAALARDLLGYDSVMVELAESACQRARELFALPAESADVHHLPFADNTVDIVLMSEVIEHLVDPIQAMAEAYRVARKAVIITTQEAAPWRWERVARMKLRELEKGHAERTFFHPDDFRAIFGERVRLLNPCLIVPLEDETRINKIEAMRRVPQLAKLIPFVPGSFGLMALALKEGKMSEKFRLDDQQLVKGLFDFSVPLPNVSRADEVTRPKWIHRITEERIENTNYNPYAPLSNSWTTDAHNHISYFKNLQNIPPADSVIERFYLRFLLILAAILRLILAPGSIGTKLCWILRSLNLNTLRKVIGA